MDIPTRKAIPRRGGIGGYGARGRVDRFGVSLGDLALRTPP